MIIPQWPAPTWIRACTTTRHEGNFDMRYGPAAWEVVCRRQNLLNKFGLSKQPLWLDQVHGNKVLEASAQSSQSFHPQEQLKLVTPPADGSWTTVPGVPCAILTADCLPVILCDEGGSVVSALHCGWRGLHSGIIHKAIEAIRPQAKGKLIAWMGPAIGPEIFEVGAEVREQFLERDIRFSLAFKPQPTPGKFLADIYKIAQFQLLLEGVTGVYGGGYCTYTQADQFYSYRRERNVGRLATMIWMENEPENMATYIWMEPRT